MTSLPTVIAILLPAKYGMSSVLDFYVFRAPGVVPKHHEVKVESKENKRAVTCRMVADSGWPHEDSWPAYWRVLPSFLTTLQCRCRGHGSIETKTTFACIQTERPDHSETR